MRVELLYPSKYLKAVDFLGKDVTMTIKSVKREEIQMQGGRKDMKVILYFEETEKMIVMNKTNAMSISELLSKECDEWIGKKVIFFPTKDRFGNKQVDCIRVKGSPDKLSDSEISEINDRIHKG